MMIRYLTCAVTLWGFTSVSSFLPAAPSWRYRISTKPPHTILQESFGDSNHGMDEFEAARQAFERIVRFDGRTGAVSVPGGYPRHVTAHEARLRETEIQLLETLRDSDAAIDPLVELWVNEREDGAKAIHRMIHVRSPGLMEEELALRAMIEDYGPDGWVEPHGRLALLFFTRNEYWEAADLCEYVLDVKPWHFEVAQLLVITHLRLGDFEKAVETARKYVLPPLHHPKRRTKWIDSMTTEAKKRLEKAQNVSDTAVTKGWFDECPNADTDCWQ